MLQSSTRIGGNPRGYPGGNLGSKPGHNPRLHPNSGHKSSPKLRSKSGQTSGPSSYASPQVIAAYLDTMRRRAAYLARRNERGRVYVSVNPFYAQSPHWPTKLTRLQHQLRPARVQTFTTAWTSEDPGAQYAAEWDSYADTLTGLVVMIGRLGVVGRGTVREIKSAQERGLPILVSAVGGRLVPLVDCRTTPITSRVPTHRLKIELPASSKRPSVTLTTCLFAMGVMPHIPKRKHPSTPKPLFMPPKRGGGQ